MSVARVKFFASLREQLGVDQIDIAVNENQSISDLIQYMANEHKASWAEILNATDIMIAVNQTLVEREHVISPGDEVAFLPPVTGG